MPWADTVFQDLDNWADCVWQNWTDCVWDRFSIVYSDRKKRTMRQLPPKALSNVRRPYLEGNPSYVEDSVRHPDKAYADAIMQATGEEVQHMEFKQPYRYESLQEMKYRDKSAFPHQGTMSAQNIIAGGAAAGAGVGGGVGQTPNEILDEGKEGESEWKWVRYLDDSQWIPIAGQWFDNRWIAGEEASSSTEKWGENSTDDYSVGTSSDILIYKFNPDTGFDGVYIAVGCGNEATKVNRTVMHFDIKNDLDAVNATSVASAILYLNPDTMNGSHTISAYRVFQYWGSAATWNSPWITAGCAAADDAGEDDGSFDRKATPESSDSTHSAGSYSTVLDLTSLAQKWFAGTAKEYGILLQSANEATNNWVRWHQSEDDPDGERPYLEIQYYIGGLDLSVTGALWKDLRPRKFRMTFINATADVSLQDSNGTELYAATYGSGGEVDLTFAGADIDRLVVSGSGDITDIEFLVQVEKGLYAGSDQRTPRQKTDPGSGYTAFPDPNPIQDSERLPRRFQQRTTRRGE